MGRTLFAPEAKTQKIDVDPLVRARSEGAMDRLLARPASTSNRLRNLFTHRVFGAPPSEGRSVLVDNEPVVRQLGFRPLTTQLTTAWYGPRTTTEVWVDPSGSIVMEAIVGSPLGDFTGHRTLSAYFTDGTSLVMWEQGADLASLYSPTRTSMVSCGFFPQDIRDFSARIVELVESGKELLHVCDVHDYARRCKLHRLHMFSGGAASAENSAAVELLLMWSLGVALMFGFLGALVSWTWAATYCAAHVAVKSTTRTGLFLKFDAWVFRRELRKGEDEAL